MPSTASPPRRPARPRLGALLVTLAAALASMGLAAPAASASQSYSERVLGRASLESYWRLGEPAGDVAADARGGRDGTYRGGSRWVLPAP